MADFGIGETLAALGTAAAATEGAAATGATLAATLPEVAAAGTAAAAAAPEVAAAVAAPEVVAPIAAAATEVPAVSGGLLGPAAGETTGFLGAAAEQPVTGGLLGGDFAIGGSAPLTTAPSATSGAIGGASGLGKAGGTLIADSLSGAPLVESPSGTIASSLVGKTGVSEGLLGDLGSSLSNWWDTASLGDKLKVGGAVLGAGGTVAKAATPPAPPQQKRTITPGKPGVPSAASMQAIEQVIKSLGQRRQRFALTGQPVTYSSSRGLLG